MPSDDVLIEAIARALCQHEGHNPDGVSSWSNDVGLWIEWERLATVALASYRKHQKEAGIVEVPREPTRDQSLAGYYSVTKYAPLEARGFAAADDVYRAMLAAAQEKDG